MECRKNLFSLCSGEKMPQEQRVPVLLSSSAVWPIPEISRREKHLPHVKFSRSPKKAQGLNKNVFSCAGDKGFCLRHGKRWGFETSRNHGVSDNTVFLTRSRLGYTPRTEPICKTEANVHGIAQSLERWFPLFARESKPYSLKF